MESFEMKSPSLLNFSSDDVEAINAKNEFTKNQTELHADESERIESEKLLCTVDEIQYFPADVPVSKHTSEPKGCNECDEENFSRIFGLFLSVLSTVLIVMTLPISMCYVVKLIQEYERAVIFRLGRVKSGSVVGPGLFFVIPCTDTYIKVDLRTVSFEVPPQEILTKDSVTINVDAVVYYKIIDPMAAVCNVEDSSNSTRLLASTTLRTVLGMKSLAETLTDRENIARDILAQLDSATDPWGIKVERVEVKDVRLPLQLQRVMAAEAEASREARAKIMAAEGEKKSAAALRDASDIICQSPAAMQLRFLQTMNHISAEKNSTIVFPLPIEILGPFRGLQYAG